MQVPRYALPICAICTNEADEFAMRPLGRNDTMVRVCKRCDEEKPVEAHGPERPFVPQGGMPTVREVQKSNYTKGNFQRGVVPVCKGNGGNWKGLNTTHDVGPRVRNGKPLHRVSRFPGGGKRARTWEECIDFVLTQPWGDRVEFYAADARYWCFQEVE